MSTNALIVVDMLNPYDHQDAEALAAGVEPIVHTLGELVARGHEREDVRLIYVNDNYGDFSASRDDLIERALRGARPDLVEPVLPPPGCAFLTKVRHSAFYGTSLGYLLQRERVDKIILTGQVTEQCVLYTALDAYVRHFSIRIARDGVAAIHPELGIAALSMMERNMRAEITTAADCLTG